MNPLPVGVDSTRETPQQMADHMLLRPIGQGAYGQVWLAKSFIGGLHAVKVIERKKFTNERDYQRELSALRKFEPISRRNPGLVAILHVGQNEQPESFYYVMELADDVHTGQTIETETYIPRTLKEEMARHPRLPLGTKLQVALSLTSALGYIHEQGLVHRDIKPSNIIFVNDMPKIADIGLITNAGEDVSDRGTLYYMPPEGPGKLTADIFSLGKVFYELFMGMPPKDYPELPHAAEEFTSVPELLRINNLILKACDPDPRKRFQTTKELYRALQAVAGIAQENQIVAQSPHSDTAKPSDEGQLKEKATDDRAKIRMAALETAHNRMQGYKIRWHLVAASLVLIFAIAGAVYLFVRGSGFVLVFMDTTAARGIYDPDNRITGNSNAKEAAEALRIMDFRDVLPPEKMHEVPVGLNWARKDHVRSLRAHLVIIHRSLFYHPWAAELSLPYPPFNTPEEYAAFEKRYKTLGDNALREFLGDIGNSVPRTQFLVYSRGTDTNWVSETFRQDWVKNLESHFPALAGRVTTLLIPGGTNGTFRDPETRFLLRSNVAHILNFPFNAQ